MYNNVQKKWCANGSDVVRKKDDVSIANAEVDVLKKKVTIKMVRKMVRMWFERMFGIRYNKNIYFLKRNYRK